MQAQVTIHTATLGACAAHHYQDPVIQRQLPQENKLCPSDCCKVMVVSAAAGLPHIPIITTVSHPPPDLNEQEPPSATAFTPSCLGREQMPEGNLHTEVEAQPKLNPRSCANKEEKGKFFHAASGTVD